MNSFKKSMTVIADVFPKFRTLKNMVTSMSKKSRFKGSFKKQHGKCAQTLFKFAWQNLYHIYWLLWRQLTFKKSLLVICKISRLFPNTLSGDGKYSLFNRDNLTQPIQMILSGKQKTYSRFFYSFLKSSLIFELFRKKYDPHCWYISEITESENLVRSMSEKPNLRGSSEKEHGKRTQICWDLNESTFSIFIDRCEDN